MSLVRPCLILILFSYLFGDSGYISKVDVSKEEYLVFLIFFGLKKLYLVRLSTLFLIFETSYSNFLLSLALI